MTLLRGFAIVLLALIVGSPAHANFGGGSSSSSTPPPQSQDAPQPGVQKTPRQEASPYYGDAYNDVTRGQKELANGKDKNAEKRFRRALERGQRACEIDSTYAEAWNLVGYCNRQLKQYDPSVTAYMKALAINPSYAEAREYLGETYVAMGKVQLAREQLVWLEENEKTEDVKQLKAVIAAFDAKNPTPAASTASTTATPATSEAPAAADSTAGR